MQCRTKREMKDPKAIIMKNGKPRLRVYVPHVGLRCLELERIRVYYSNPAGSCY